MMENGNVEYITQLNQNDVLFGRGSGPNDHEGNIRFRTLVGERKAEYMATNHRQTKAKIAREIVSAVLDKNGRFLKKLEPAEAKELGVPKGVDAYVCVDDETVMEKAKQALRQQRDKNKSTPTKSPKGSPEVTQKKESKPPTTISLNNYPSPNEFDPTLARNNLAQSLPRTHLDTGLYIHPEMTHPNPYEPVPIGYNAIFNNDNAMQLDWRNYVQAAIFAQTQGLQDYRMFQQEGAIPQTSVSNPQSFISTSPLSGGDEIRSGNRHVSAERGRRESLQVTDLMDSFTKMKTKGLDAGNESHDTLGTSISKNYESTDTMGTIDPLPLTNRDPTNLSMSSGAFSALFKGSLNESSRCTESPMLKGMHGDTNIEPNSTIGSTAKSGFSRSLRRDLGRQSINIDDKDLRKYMSKMNASGLDYSANMSMSFSQVWNPKNLPNLGNVTEGDENLDDSEKKMKSGPSEVVLMEDDTEGMSGLGKSSMSILNVAMADSQCESLMTANESIFSDFGE
jgi:hypothetical protein